MKKHSDTSATAAGQTEEQAVTSLIGLGQQSARKSYYPELIARLDELQEEKVRYKRLNEELEHLNEGLEQRVDERTRELTVLNEQLLQEIAEREQIEYELKLARDAAQEANRNKDKYFAAASHDLLQPMNAARLLVAALRERQLPDMDSAMVEQVHLALENAEDLLTDLLDISRLDQNAVIPDINEFYLRQMLSSLYAEFLPVAENKGLSLKMVTNSMAVRSDSRLLMRIVRNLISNAIRYTSSGKVLVGCRKEGQHVLIQVWDTGDGIPVEQQGHIFKEFNQLEQHRGKNRQGLGLGLAIVERISRMLEHPVCIRSVEGKGSVFSVTVPLANENTVVTGKVRYSEPVPELLHNRHVLVVDNEDSILLSMDALLTQWGGRVICANNAEEAMALCQDEGFVPEVILADFHLHDGLLGTDCVAALRNYFQLDIPAVMLTADRSNESRKLFSQLELPVLNKPVKPGKLRALLTHILSQH